MALILCRSCKRAFINSTQEEEFCPGCVAKLRELYPLVRNFLRNNEKEAYTAQDVSKIMGIELKDVEALVSMGFVETMARPGVADSGKSGMHVHDRKKAKDTERRA